MVKLYTEKTDDFYGETEVSTVFIEYDNKILLLKRASNNTWAVPGGKLEKYESAVSALNREIKEELQVSINENDLRYLKSFYVENSFMQYQLHVFHLKLNTLIDIKLNSKEHTDYVWQAKDKFSDLNLLEAQKETFDAIVSLL